MKLTREKLPFLLGLAGVFLLAVGTVFLPRHISRMLDSGRLNRVTLADRSNFSYLEQSSGGIPEDAHALSYLGEEDNLTLLSSLDAEDARRNVNLLDAVFWEAQTASESGLLPWIDLDPQADGGVLDGTEDAQYGEETAAESTAMDEDYDAYWVSQIRFVEYYSLSYDSDEDSNTRELLNLWYLRFSDGRNFDYFFLVSAVNYRIYYAEIYNSESDLHAELAEQRFSSEETSYGTDYDYRYFDDLFLNGCLTYYNETTDFRYVEGKSSNSYLGMTVLHFDDQTVYVERQAREPQGRVPWRGIAVGFRGLAEEMQQLRK
ncbi:MAG: hypothetical protein Q4C82_05710 [Eubacteriales bacterium]|nr:hypothetical protein [Eubacteriales bacterium]